MERDKLLVEFDWTSEVDDIAGGGDAVIVFSSICRLHVVYNVAFAVLFVLVWLVVAVKRATAQHIVVAW